MSLRLDTGGSAVKSSGVFRPHRLVAQDVGFSARKPGFDSPWGYSGPVSDHEAVQPASAGCTAFFTRSGRSPRGIQVRFFRRSWLQRRELHRHRFFIGSTTVFGCPSRAGNVDVHAGWGVAPSTDPDGLGRQRCSFAPGWRPCGLPVPSGMLWGLFVAPVPPITPCLSR